MTKSTIKNRTSQKLVVTVAESKDSSKLAFVAHGLGGFKEQKHIEVFAEVFADAGYTVVRWDARNSIGESAGKNEEGTFSGYYSDFEDVVVWSKRQPWFAEPFVVCGHSLGGYCAALYAERHPDEVKGLAPISTTVNGKLFREQLRKAHPEQYAEWERTGVRITESQSKPGVMKRLKWSFVEDAMRHDLLPDVDKLTMPVLLIVGDSDDATPLDQQKLLLDAIPSKRKELHVLKGVEHTPRDEKSLAEIKSIFSNWIREL